MLKYVNLKKKCFCLCFWPKIRPSKFHFCFGKPPKMAKRVSLRKMKNARGSLVFFNNRYVISLKTFHWNNRNTSKVATGKSNFNKWLILLRSFQCVFWMEDIQGYPNLVSYFGMCVGMHKSWEKVQFCWVAKFRGFYGQVYQMQ